MGEHEINQFSHTIYKIIFIIKSFILAHACKSIYTNNILRNDDVR